MSAEQFLCHYRVSKVMHLEGCTLKYLRLQVMSITETQVSAHIACVALGAVLQMRICSAVQHVSAAFSLKQ